MDFSSEICFDKFVGVHEPQLLACGLPQHYWESLYRKLNEQKLDAGEYFQIIVEESAQADVRESNVVSLSELRVADPENVFLIDHAWTFRPNTARLALQQVDGLCERLSEALDIKDDFFFDCAENSQNGGDNESHFDPNLPSNSKSKRDSTEDEDQQMSKDILIDRILDKMWSYVQTYSLRICDSEMDENQIPIWYLPDEFGIRVGHSLEPNVRIVPFFYLFKNMAFSILFPLVDIPAETIITRNFVDTQLMKNHPDWQPFLLHPWQPGNFTHLPIKHVEKTSNYFMNGRLMDLFPTEEALKNVNFKKDSDEELIVCASDLQLISKMNKYKITQTSDPMTADIVWKREHFYDFRALAEKNPGALINQFPFESILTVKDLLAATIQSAYDNFLVDEKTLDLAPKWFPITFNLELELPAFVAYFQKRAQKCLDNIWIVKPWNLARGMDIHVTRNLNAVIRLAESGPKIVSKYIHNPVLFRRHDNENLVKFDLRYIVFVRGVDPLDILIYNKFWIRFAFNSFNIDQLDDVFSHLTVFNYSNKEMIYQIQCEEFIEKIEKQYPELKWDNIQAKINSVIKNIFLAVTKQKPPFGISPNKQSRAMYGIDLMLHWGHHQPPYNSETVEVKFIEANFMPDCERACQYYPNFADIVFDTLFFDSFHPNEVTSL